MDETEWLAYTDPKQGEEDRCEKGSRPKRIVQAAIRVAGKAD